MEFMLPIKQKEGTIDLTMFLKAVRKHFSTGADIDTVKNIIINKYPNIQITFSDKVTKSSKLKPKEAIIILAGYGLSEPKIEIIKKYLEYRYEQHKFKYTQIALSALFNKIKDVNDDLLEFSVQYCISSGYMALIIKEDKKEIKKLSKFNHEPL